MVDIGRDVWVSARNQKGHDYRDEDFYVDDLAVSDDGVITASGLGNVEFAREIFRLLKIYDENDLRTWYDMFKRGLMPAGMA